VRIAALLAAALVLASCAPTATLTPSASPPLPTTAVLTTPSAVPSAVGARGMPEAQAAQLVGGRARQTLDVIKRRDISGLAALVHPSKGVRFSPYPYVQPAQDQKLSAVEVVPAFGSGTKRLWGRRDGRGDDVLLTFAEYLDQFVYTRDFASSTEVAYNREIQRGNRIDNTPDVYPEAIMFEALDPGPDPQFRDTRWQSVRLLFERHGDDWYLVGVIHGEWTI
jgi:hypothetical protein